MNKKYQIIYADPPWKYNNRADNDTRYKGGAGNHYSLMDMKEIERLPINNLSDDNCALFLWVTFPILDEQIRLFKKWGFDYKTLGFSWIKLNSKNFSKKTTFLEKTDNFQKTFLFSKKV